MSARTFYEILEEVDQQRGPKKRIATLHKYSSKSLKTLLDYTFNPKIKWVLPPGEPPYVPAKDQPELLINRLAQELRRLRIFTDTKEYKNLKQNKRESVFLDILQSIHPDDAKLLVAMKERTLPFKNITPELIKEAFPIFTKNWVK